MSREGSKGAHWGSFESSCAAILKSLDLVDEDAKMRGNAKFERQLMEWVDEQLLTSNGAFADLLKKLTSVLKKRVEQREKRHKVSATRDELVLLTRVLHCVQRPPLPAAANGLEEENYALRRQVHALTAESRAKDLLLQEQAEQIAELTAAANRKRTMLEMTAASALSEM